MIIEVDISKYHMPTTLQLNTATSRAINHTLSKAVTAGNRAVIKEWNIKTKDLKGYETIQRANVNTQVAKIIIKSRSISLFKFNARQLKRGVSYKIKKSKGREVLLHSFIAKTKSGYTGVFTRKGKKRLPINTFKSISPSSMYKGKGVEAIEIVIDRDYANRFIHELSRVSK